MPALYCALGRWISRHPVLVVIVWSGLLGLAFPYARRASPLLDPGSGQIAGTNSALADDLLANEFSNPFGQSLVVTFHSRTGHFDDPAFQRAVGVLVESLRHSPGVARAILPDQKFGTRFRSADRHGIAILVGLNVPSISEAQKLVPVIRQRIDQVLSPSQLPAWEWHVTGRAAMLYDLNRYNAADSKRAELRALPLALIVLVLVFGALVSASLPLALGLSSTLLALSLVPMFVHFAPLNLLYENVVSLLGLALGIDYSLFMVSRYREQRAHAGSDRERSVVETMASTGVAITYSGLTVLIGLAGLLLTPIFEMRSMGLGGMVVVAMSLLLALTLLPALLCLLDPWLGSPRKLVSLLSLGSSRRRWEKWTAFVLRYPALPLFLGAGLLLILSAPLLTYRPGFPDKPWMPARMETTHGLEVLRDLGQAQELTPINLVVSADDDTPLLPDHLDAFFALSEKIKQDPHVARVFGPVDLGEEHARYELRVLYDNLVDNLAKYPELGELLLSRKHDRALVQVVLKDQTSYDDSLAAARALSRLSVPGLRILAGGQWPAINDYDSLLLSAYPVVFGLVIATTLVVLVFAFHSAFVPIKALVLNTLSVTAAFGATVAVFQWGWGSSWLGLAEPPGAIPYTIPLIVFCITFGLSMDYEVLLLSRVREEHLLCHDTDLSVRRGLIATGKLISGAAAIMVVVFGAFALADVMIVKMLGFGLAVAVAVDAIIVRVMMVPAAMKLAGRWNWWPGFKGTGN